MIVNIYLNEGRFLTSQVDEGTSHLLGDLLIHNNKEYVILKIEEKEHIDYQTIIRINELVEKSYNDNELDEVNKIGIHIE